MQRAVIAARVNDPDTAYDQLERAKQIAGRLGEGRNDYNTEFGPANVGLQEVAIAVDLGDAGRALRASYAVDTSGLSAERRALRAQAMGESMRLRSGLSEGLDVTLRLRKPADAMGLHDWTAQDVVPMHAALDEIWTRWDQDGVRLANDVVGKCMDLLGTSPARSTRSGPVLPGRAAR